MPYFLAAAVIILGGALSFGMTGMKLKRPKRRRPQVTTGTANPARGWRLWLRSRTDPQR
jgi:hypothetical protein